MPARVAAVVARAPWGTYEPGQMVAAIFLIFFPENHAAKVGPRILRPLILTMKKINPTTTEHHHPLLPSHTHTHTPAHTHDHC